MTMADLPNSPDLRCDCLTPVPLLMANEGRAYLVCTVCRRYLLLALESVAAPREQ